MSGKKYDVFLSHNRNDKAVVSDIAVELVRKGIEPFLDKWHLIPGDPWQEALERALENSQACAVFLGPDGLGTWEHEEMRVALEHRARQKMSRVFAVLLPGSLVPDRATLPSFLSRFTWVDLRSGWEHPENFRQLLCGIRGESLGPPSPPRFPRSAVEPSIESPNRLDRSPYRGMVHFRTEDADLFYGREALTKFLIERLRDRYFLAVVGPSGSGKSSLVRAGLIPTLRNGALPGSTTWSIVLLKPGERPLRELAARLLHLVDPELTLDAFCEAMKNNACTLATEVRRTAQSQILLVIDQFEEIFTQASPDERQGFLANLIDASSLMSARVIVIVILRADFYASVAAYPDLADRIAARQVIVTPMQESELWEAISKPATHSGLHFEEGLGDAILREMRGQSEALPLLQQALLEIWKNRDGNTLTLSAYRTAGEVKGAIATWAESVYKNLTVDQQRLTHRILIELVQPGNDTKDTRRRVLQKSIRFGQPPADEETLEILIQSRILITDSDPISKEKMIEITHESLLQEWPRLRNWLEESRQFRLAKSRLQERTKLWIRYERSPEILARGPELEEFERCSQLKAEEIGPLEEEYLKASIDARGTASDKGLPLKRAPFEQEPTQRDSPEANFGYVNYLARRSYVGGGGGGRPILDIQYPWDLSATGWAVVFAPNLDRQVRSALRDLLEYRKAQATHDYPFFYRELTYQNESTADFLRRNGARPGMIADPNYLPYYLLLVGDPEALPYRFQSELDVNYAVGRIYFDRIDDYAAYAHSVIMTETQNKPRPRKVAFFGTAHENDPSSQRTAQGLVHKLAESVRQLTPGWEVQEVLGAQARKERLRALLGGPETPAFLFTACHGLGFSDDDERQASYQGSLVCQDWPGPEDDEGVSEEQWFAASDLPEAASLQGLIAFFYSCYSLGTPQCDNFDETAIDRPRQIAPKAFVSQLPQKLLAHRNGGMLALIGHVDRSWTSSFEGSSQGEGISAFKHVIYRLLEGHTVGWSMEYLNRFYASLAAMHGNVEEEWRNGGSIDRELFSQLWLLRNDARNFMVFGDPAVRLPGVGEPR